MPDAAYWIQKLQLEPHPEGGYFRETYRAGLTIPSFALPHTFRDTRPVSTAIYFLLEGADFSAFHRIASDEMWHFYAGGTLCVHSIDEEGRYAQLKLGPGSDGEERFQAVVPAGRWFAASVQDPGSFTLVGCTVSPGFDFADFELAHRSELGRRFPQHRALIERFTRTTT